MSAGNQTAINGRQEDGLILNLQRFSVDDGPGIRTTVFFKGCPLHCQWCQNPESISEKPQVWWLENRCLACGTCIKACPNNCLFMRGKSILIDRDCCSGCGKCARECPANALNLLGAEISEDELFKEVIKDLAFFEKSGGGATVSGGEPTRQTDFVASFLRRLKKAGVNTALDTCGLCSVKSLEKILPFTDVVLYDLKEIDPDKHSAFTGQDNQMIFGNLLYIRDYIREKTLDTKLWIRTPLIPEATATCENLTGLGDFLARNLNNFIQRWELCAFNNLCRDKYRRLGIEWRFINSRLLTEEDLRELEKCAKRSGVDPDMVTTTGAAGSKPHRREIRYEAKMNDRRNRYHSFSEAERRAFESELKVGMLATVSETGLPHLTLISTLQAGTPREVIWGQFTEGLSKKNVGNNPKTAFLIMTSAKELWRGQADFTHTEKQGMEFEMFNNKPMFRYNAYMGLHTVYYMDLVEHYGEEILPYRGIWKALVKTLVAQKISGKKRKKHVLNFWSRKLLNRVSNPKFLSYVGKEGYPIIVPVIQALTGDGRQVIFSLSAYQDELEAILDNTPVTVFCMSLSAEELLIRGTFGRKRIAGFRCGIVNIDWVYNPMPPKPQQIYPEPDISPVTSF